MRLFNLYLDEDMNRPGKTEWYLMNLSADLRRIVPSLLVKGFDPDKVQPRDSILTFGKRDEDEEKKPLPASVMKSVIVGGLGLGDNVVHRRISKAEAVENIRRLGG